MSGREGGYLDQKKSNQHLNFHAGALQPKWVSLFNLIRCKLIPITHTSHITLDRAILLYAMIKKMNVVTGMLIYNHMLETVKPSKAL